MERLSVVILTHDRVLELQRTLGHMLVLDGASAPLVVDNGSSGATRELIRRDFPTVRLIALKINIGAAARNAGVRAVDTPYVAFCDDDTWWERGALEKAAALLDAHPDVAVLRARVLVGPHRMEDPTCALMASSPLPQGKLPGPALLGFLAGAAVMRRSAFLEAGGYQPTLFI